MTLATAYDFQGFQKISKKYPCSLTNLKTEINTGTFSDPNHLISDPLGWNVTRKNLETVPGVKPIPCLTLFQKPHNYLTAPIHVGKGQTTHYLTMLLRGMFKIPNVYT